MRDIEWIDFRVSIEGPDVKPVLIEGYEVPQRFAINYLFKDQKPRSHKLWGARMVLEFSPDVVPRAIEVTVKGFTHTHKKGIVAPLVSGEPVERWQLQSVERNIQDLTALAVSLSYQEVTYDEEAAELRQEMREKIEKGTADLIPSEIERFNWDDLALYNPWVTNSNSSKALFDSGIAWQVDSKIMEEIRANISSRVRRRAMSNSHYKEVARIYIEEKERAKNVTQRAEPVKVLMEKFHTHERTVGFWIKEARVRDLIPPLPKKNSKPSNKAGSSTTKKTNKEGIK